jgi:DNA-binding CsgD family transcriptional regulator
LGVDDPGLGGFFVYGRFRDNGFLRRSSFVYGGSRNSIRERLKAVLSKKEANALLEIIDGGLRSKSEEDLRQLVLRLQDLVPFEFALCSLSSISCRSADPYSVINVSYPLPWIDRYISEQLDTIDPVLVEHRLHFGLQYWIDSYERHPEAKQFIMSASDYGLKNGYSYGLKTESGSGASLFSFGGRSMERSRRTCHILRRIMPHLHQALVRVVAPLDHLPEAAQVKLSPREREVLLWIKEGKTTSEISSTLSISERTVKFHVRNTLRKVRASTRAQAVAVSLEKGLIDID